MVNDHPDLQRSDRLQQANGLSIASLILGILAFLSGWFFMGLVFGITAIILGIIGIKKPNGRSLAITGIVLGGVGALFGAIFTTVLIIALSQGGNITTDLSKIRSGLAEQGKNAKTQINAKKDFAKGETAIFGDFEVKVESVQRNFEPANAAVRAAAGKEFVLINVNIKNTGQATKSIGRSDLKMNDNGTVSNPLAIDSPSAFTGANLSSGAVTKGSLVYEVTKDASGLKLQYQTLVLDVEKSQAKMLVYTLGL